jgi:hypothetical protein
VHCTLHDSSNVHCTMCITIVSDNNEVYLIESNNIIDSIIEQLIIKSKTRLNRRTTVMESK